MSEHTDGILNLNKPAGWTSHDVIARLRRVLGQRSVGHAGTLDPMATGVLLVGIGQGTRVVEYLTAGEKAYHAVIRLGMTTDTYDRDGAVTSVAQVPKLSADELKTALAQFVGEIQQVPPIYSAIKKGGTPLYRLARRGEEVDLVARPVVIQQIAVEAWEEPDLTVEVTCGPGTYIRSLAHDLGQVLGCGATLMELTRTRSGRFTIQEAISLDAFADAVAEGDAARYVRPMSTALTELRAVPVTSEDVLRLVHGLAITCESEPHPAAGYALAADGSVAAILAYDAASHVWRPRKVFAQPC